MAGLIIAQVAELTGMPFMGAAVVLYLAAVWYAVFGIFLLTIRVPRVPRAQGRNILHDIVEGLRVIWRDKVILFLIGMVFFTSYFGGRTLSCCLFLPRTFWAVGPRSWVFCSQPGGSAAFQERSSGRVWEL